VNSRRANANGKARKRDEIPRAIRNAAVVHIEEDDRGCVAMHCVTLCCAASHSLWLTLHATSSRCHSFVVENVLISLRGDDEFSEGRGFRGKMKIIVDENFAEVKI